MSSIYDFVGRVALVTGAGTGIGAATAKSFAEAGAAVIVADINQKNAKEVEDEIVSRGGRAITVGVDVSDAESVKAMIDHAVREYKVIDFAFNNAGIMGGFSTIADCTEENWNRVIGVNLTGVFHCMKYELLEMQKRRQGVIVNTSSIAGLVGLDAKLPGYAASKHGVLGLTKTAALENASLGIRVNAVCPGEIDTPMQKEYEALLKKHADQSPELAAVRRNGTPQEVAEAVLWLCSDRSSFVNGHALAVDDGYTIQ